MDGTQPGPGQDDRRRGPLGAVVGLLLGFALGAAIHLGLDPVLERAGPPLEDLQGLLWNVVPVLTVVGALVGHRLWTR